MRQGIAFEDRVAGYLAQRADLTRITTDGLESRDLEKAKATIAALRGRLRDRPWRAPLERGDPNLRHPRLPHPVRRIRPALPKSPGPVRRTRGRSRWMPAARSGWRYVVVDAKFTTLHLFAETAPGRKPRKGSRPGEINNQGSSPAYRAQLFLYNAALARLQGCAPRRAFLLGRGWEQSKRARRSAPSTGLARFR